ncbi:PH domain-containing protein [Corynebacterium sp. 11A]|uniref:PH domain-containing protein n=1 Tax=Corynebacterium sp. 11A TaxID=2080510 RepID=UPI00124E6A27|nr:PH domain-containing protein [Corynebacterium sp. 11A]
MASHTELNQRDADAMGVTFQPVSPALVKARLIGRMPVLVLATLGMAIGAYFVSGGWQIALIVGAIAMAGLSAFIAWLTVVQVARIGWAETEDELLVRRGRLFYSLTVVPYGRIQFVDINNGPIERALGLKNIELHTASSTSDSSIPGLPEDVASELRVRLSEKAKERMSGL